MRGIGTEHVPSRNILGQEPTLITSRTCAILMLVMLCCRVTVLA